MKFTTLAFVAAVASAQDTAFEGCSFQEYYMPLNATATGRQAEPLYPMEDLAWLVRHEGQLPIIPEKQGDDYIYKALLDLDPGMTPNYVELIYRQTEMKFSTHANIDTWDRENLWPIERGATRGSQAVTDVHSTRPGDTSVLRRKGGYFFGECGTVENMDACQSPANMETPADTAQDGKIFTPPVSARGDIARALFYTALRYGGELGLKLTDCPPFSNNEFGYLSPLLQWHKDDPVDDTERTRNERACSRWQGNRNPFVDFPHLVSEYWGEPDFIVEGTHSYSKCTTPTNAPTATPNQCSKMKAGDIPIYVINTDNPDQIILFPLTDLPANMEKIYVTTDAWNGTDFMGKEGTMEFNIPEEGIRAGQSFGFGQGSPFESEWDISGEFSLDISGQQILVYCVNADNIPHFIGAFSNNGPFAEPGLSEYEPGTTSLPAALSETGSIVLPHHDNCLYKGQNTGTAGDLKKWFADPENYDCEDALRFEILGDGDSGAGAAVLLYSFVAMLCMTLAL